MHAEHAGSLLGSSLQQHARAWAYAELHTTPAIPHQPGRCDELHNIQGY